MEKVRRIARVVAMTKLLVERPDHLFSLNYFSELFNAAKSTISEDMVTIKQSLQMFGLGTLETVAGAAGGVRYLPLKTGARVNVLLTELADRLVAPERVIPGGFLYMSDILFDSQLMMQAGEIFFSRFAHLKPDYIITVETKGIPLAFATARAFNLPLVIARRGSKVTEGSAVSINYVTGSSRRIQTMSLPKRALQPGARVLVIDDFMKAGGTAKGIIELVQEVGAEVVGTGVLVATAQPEEKLVQDYLALLILYTVDEHTKTTDIRPALVK